MARTRTHRANGRRRPGRLRAAVPVLLLATAAQTAGTAAAVAPAEVFAVGGRRAMPPPALADVEATTGRTPTRIEGPDRYATAVAVSKHAHPDGARSVYLATGADFADALAAAPAVEASEGVLLLVDPAVLPPVVADELRRLGPEQVYVLGGRAAVSDGVLDRVHDVTGVRPVRLEGRTRYGTAAAASRHARPDGAATVFLATGRAFPDALAAVPGVAAHDAALVLVDRDHVPPEAAEELARLGPGEILALGGRLALSDRVLADVASLTGVEPRRLAGPDRFATAAAAGRHAHPDGAAVVYAVTGWRFPDALAAATAVTARDAGLLLVDSRPRWTPDVGAARAYADARAGNVSFAVIGTDRLLRGHGEAVRAPMASTLKVMFMVAWLRQPSVRDRPLTDADRSLLEPMITRSENAPATRLANHLGPGPMYDLARVAGMQDFSYTRPWGLSRTSARDQARFLLRLEEFIPPRHRTYALDLLTRIVPEQRWGVGQVPTPDWILRFKGGWGSGTGATDHQVVQLEYLEGTRVSLAVFITNSPSHAYGKETLRGVFSRLLADLP